MSENTATDTSSDSPSAPAFRTPLPVRLFLVAAAVVLVKTIYDISEQSKVNQQAIEQLNRQVSGLTAPISELNRSVERLNGGFSDMVQGVGRMGTTLNKSARNIQLIQNEVHEEMATIRKKVNDISNRVTSIQQDLRNPFRR